MRCSLRPFYAGLALALGVSAAGLPAAFGAAANDSSPCSPAIKPASSSYGYRRIGDRCEGEFQQEVGSTLDLVSLTAGALPRPSGVSEHLSLSWPAVPAMDLEITGRVLEQHKYYRMDATPSTSTGSYRWQLGDLQNAGYGTKRLAIRAVAKTTSPPGTGPLHVPIATAYSDALVTETPTSYYAVFVCGDDVQSLKATVHGLIDGTPTAQIHEQVIQGPFAPMYPITVKFPVMKGESQRYLISVVAHTSLKDGAPLEFEMIHGRAR